MQYMLLNRGIIQVNIIYKFYHPYIQDTLVDMINKHLLYLKHIHSKGK